MTTGSTFTWIGPLSGDWNTASNWNDTSDGQNPAPQPPGAADSAIVNGTTGQALSISGSASVANATFNNNNDVLGLLNVGSLLVAGTADIAGTVSATALTVSAVPVAPGTPVGVTAGMVLGLVSVSGNGAELTVSGTLAGAPNFFPVGSDLLAANGGLVQITAPSFTNFLLSVDAQSSIEIGAGGSAVPGTITFAPGSSTSLAGDYFASPVIVGSGAIINTASPQVTFGSSLVVNQGASILGNGTLVAQALSDNGLIAGSQLHFISANNSNGAPHGISGSGIIEAVNGGHIVVDQNVTTGTLTFKLDNNATLDVDNFASIAAGNTIDFAGTQAVLRLNEFSDDHYGGPYLGVGQGNVPAIFFFGIGIEYAVGAVSPLPTVDATITGFTTGDSIVISQAVVTGSTFVAGSQGNPGTLTLLNGTTAVGKLKFASGVSDPQLSVVANPSYPITQSIFPTVTITAQPAGICFGAGTHIATPDGEVPVEELSVGDLVLTVDGKAEPIAWIGQGCVLVTPGRRSAATPVIVRQNALAPDVPHRDLRLTKGHCLYLEGALIPVEFLVNHRSIVWDDMTKELVTYHIELARHDVLIAEGALAESYRDDGNRWLFHNANQGWHLPPQAPCAPVLTGGPLADSIWRWLLDYAGPGRDISLTDDPDLHLVVDGRRLNGKPCGPDALRFLLPKRPHEVRIVSRAGAPDELGIARDPRRLGVAIRQIMIRQGTKVSIIEAHDPMLADGFHAFEPDNGFRWTNGMGVLPATGWSQTDGPFELELRIGCTALYPAFDENPVLLRA